MNNSDPLKNTTLRSNDIYCPSCVGMIETRLNGLDGVDSAEVNFASGRVVVTHNPSKVSVHSLVDAVVDIGYTVKPSAI